MASPWLGLLLLRASAGMPAESGRGGHHLVYEEAPPPDFTRSGGLFKYGSPTGQRIAEDLTPTDDLAAPTLFRTNGGDATAPRTVPLPIRVV